MKRTMLVMAVVLSVFSIGRAEASTIGWSVDTISDVLYQIDLNTGTTTAVGSGIGFSDVEGLSFDPITGLLYGINDSSSNDALILIDTTTGIGTTVGLTGFNFSDTGLGFTADGTLYAASDLSNDGVYTINKVTGVATFLSDGGPDSTGLAGDSTGALFGVTDDTSPDTLVSINTVTGVSTAIGSLGVSVDEAGLAFDSNDVLFMLDGGDQNIYTIDTLTGAASSSITFDDSSLRFEGLAIQRPVPEPGSLVIWSSIAGIGFFARRRRKAKAAA